ncbi:MAG TPA: prepilin peptidase [Egibacteraceae bacterium]|jgi:leader peptidase (prepilin peptidase) / N-methyltransferase|nr:prepilin peptidase [Egibacteraceae bacterium]
MDLVVVGLCFVFGLAFGSFANVVIHRVPRDESLVKPPSECPKCATPLQWRDNIPIVSWLLLRGRCRHCGEPISARYPLVELATGLLFAGVGARFGLDWALPGFLLFAWTLFVLAVIDAHTRKIPNRLTYPLTPVLLALIVSAALLHGQPGWALRAVLGGVAAFLVLLAMALANPRGMGMGDVKLAAFIGIGLGYLGWGHVVLGVFAGFLFGGVVAIALIVVRARGRKDVIPFGPYLAAGALVTVLVGGPLIDGYRSMLGL